MRPGDERVVVALIVRTPRDGDGRAMATSSTPEPPPADPRAPVHDPGGPQRRRVVVRRALSVLVLLAGLGAVGVGGGHALGAVGAHDAAEHVHHSWPGDRDGEGDGLVYRPLPGPIAPPAPGR